MISYKKKLILIIGFMFSLSISAGAYEASQAGMSQDRLEKIAPTLLQQIKEGRFPGFVTAVARKGRVVHYETQGFSDVEKQIPLQKDSLFRIYSMSKPITGVALMILIEEGKVRLNDPVSWYIPEFANTEVMVMNEDGSFTTEKLKREITIRAVSYTHLTLPTNREV